MNVRRLPDPHASPLFDHLLLSGNTILLRAGNINQLCCCRSAGSLNELFHEPSWQASAAYDKQCTSLDAGRRGLQRWKSLQRAIDGGPPPLRPIDQPVSWMLLTGFALND